MVWKKSLELTAHTASKRNVPIHGGRTCYKVTAGIWVFRLIFGATLPLRAGSHEDVKFTEHGKSGVTHCTHRDLTKSHAIFFKKSKHRSMGVQLNLGPTLPPLTGWNASSSNLETHNSSQILMRFATEFTSSTQAHGWKKFPCFGRSNSPKKNWITRMNFTGLIIYDEFWKWR